MSAVRPRVAAAAAVAFGLVAVTLAQGTFAAGTPANKVAASGSTLEVFGANEPHVVLSETIRATNPGDLILGVTAECAILTEVTNSANGQTERAFGQITFEVRIDGVTVPVASDSPKGDVVFCNRAQEQQWSGDPDSYDNLAGDDDDADDELRQHLDTRTANGFNWLALNVGSGLHKIEVVATWTTEATTNAIAQASVGSRSLVIEPVYAAVGEAVTELG